MQLLIPLKVGQRLGAAMGLVLLLTTLISGLSIALSQRLNADLLQVDEHNLPSVQLVHELGLLVQGQRGMAALALLPQPGPDRDALDARLQATRQTIQRRMAAYATRVAGAADRQHFDAVKASFVVFWATQDRLLAASRLAAIEPTANPTSPALAHARSLLTGESQHAFLQLGADLDAWWAFHALATHQLVQQAHAAVQQAMVMLVGLCAVAWLLGVAAWRLTRQIHRNGQAAPASPAAKSLAPAQRADADAGPSQAAARAILVARASTAPHGRAGGLTSQAATEAPPQAPAQAPAQVAANPASQATPQPSDPPITQPSRSPPG